MQIIEDILTTLDFNTELKDIRQGVFHTGVLSRYCGVAATLPRDALEQSPPMVREPGTLLDKSPRELAELAFSTQLLEAAMGMAAINSLLEVDPADCVECNAAEILMNKGSGKTVGVVGHFPFIPKLKTTTRRLYVIEKNPQPGDHGAHEAEDILPQADVVAITGTALTNHSIEGLLKLCRPNTYVIMLGDTVPMTPVLFDYGVDVISGTRVTDPETALRCISQGANFRQIKGTLRLSMMKTT